MRTFFLSLALLTSSCELISTDELLEDQIQPDTQRVRCFVDQCEVAEDGEGRCLLLTEDGSMINTPTNLLPPATREGDEIYVRFTVLPQ